MSEYLGMWYIMGVTAECMEIMSEYVCMKSEQGVADVIKCVWNGVKSKQD